MVKYTLNKILNPFNKDESSIGAVARSKEFKEEREFSFNIINLQIDL